MSGGHEHFTLFFNFRTSKDLEILRQSSYMSHILKGLSKRDTHIPHIVLYDEDKKVCSNANFGVFTAGGHFWRVTRNIQMWFLLSFSKAFLWYFADFEMAVKQCLFFEMY